jgi:hypothetical protein
VFRTLAVIAAVAGLAACTSGSLRTAPGALAGEDLAGKRIAVVAAPPPPFAAGTVDEALTASYGIEDPAVRIGRGVALRLVTERGMTLLLDAGAEAQADYVIDVQTRQWALAAFALGRDRYGLKYEARLRLLARTDGRVLAETVCRSEQGDRDYPPSRDELLANGAALVKGYLDMATAACVDLAVRDSLQLGTPNVARATVTGAISGSAAPAAASAAVPAGTSPAPPLRRAAAAMAQAEPRASREPLRATPQDSASPSRVTAQPTMAPVQPAPATPVPVRPTPQPAAGPDPRQIEQAQLLRRDTLSEAARASGQVIVLLEDTPFRDSPRRVSAVTRTLAAGKDVIVRQRIYNAEGEWWFIATPGDVGWIPSPDPSIRRGR